MKCLYCDNEAIYVYALCLPHGQKGPCVIYESLTSDPCQTEMYLRIELRYFKSSTQIKSTGSADYFGFKIFILIETEMKLCDIKFT